MNMALEQILGFIIGGVLYGVSNICAWTIGFSIVDRAGEAEDDEASNSITFVLCDSKS